MLLPPTCFHQHACLLVCLSLLSVCLSVKLQWMIQVTKEIQGKGLSLPVESGASMIEKGLKLQQITLSFASDFIIKLYESCTQI